MCDTFYAPGRGAFFFGKNSDRKPEEPQTVCVLPRVPESSETETTGGSIPYPDKGYSVLLSKPSWMIGGEIGVNDKGVAIGNEAVFSRWPVKKDGVLGMDFLRSALRSAASAEEAVRILAELTERFEQGGNGAFQGKLYYHNAYLITGFDGAYVLETAAKRWAWKRLEEASAISNSYSLETDYKRLDDETRKAIAPVNEKMACYDDADAGRKGERASWKQYAESRLHASFTKGDVRRRAMVARAREAGERFDLATVFGILRSRSLPDPISPRRCATICAYDRDNLGYPTTASMAVEYDAEANRCMVWFTGTSYPDLSLYKPVVLEKERFIPLWTDYDYSQDAPSSLEYWRRGRKRYLAVGTELSADSGFRERRDAAQAKILEAVSRYGTDGLESVRTAVGAVVSEWEGSWGRD